MTIKEVIARIRRTGSSRGFGIQSPSDYSFVCDIVNCPYPYYAYSDLREAITGITRKERKKAELLFRIANFMQPDTVTNLGMERWYETYISSACKHTKMYNQTDMRNQDECDHRKNKMHSLVLVSCRTPQNRQTLSQDIYDGTCLIADGINADSQARRQWETIVGNSHSTLVFDLYDMGIVIADAKRSKAMYKINY